VQAFLAFMRVHAAAYLTLPFSRAGFCLSRTITSHSFFRSVALKVKMENMSLNQSI
jgi:hypothetical protein